MALTVVGLNIHVGLSTEGVKPYLVFNPCLIAVTQIYTCIVYTVFNTWTKLAMLTLILCVHCMCKSTSHGGKKKAEQAGG